MKHSKFLVLVDVKETQGELFSGAEAVCWMTPRTNDLGRKRPADKSSARISIDEHLSAGVSLAMGALKPTC